jgi:hypothetical protein
MNNFLKPPIETNAQNKLRTVGFELEYSAVELQKSAQLLLQTVGGGTIKEINPYYYKIEATPFGNFSLMLDFQFLISKGLEKWLHDVKLDRIIKKEIALALEEFIATLSQTIVPYEISTPPLAIDKLDIMEEIKENFRKNGAQGTDANPLYAFGFHINPQLHSFEVAEIVDTLKAFFLLYDYLVDLLEPDIVRRITPYIDPFDEIYIKKILDNSYAPNMQEFIEDYLFFNPTRNRALDLLPLLAFIDAKTLFATLPDEKISPRPTYHYRLPNSKIDEESWHTYEAWNSWILVEKLAFDKQTLREFSQEYLTLLNDPLCLLVKDGWVEKMKLWHKKQK